MTFYPKTDRHNEDVDRWPILAWELSLESEFHRAITLWSSLSESEDENSVILCPDGRVVSPGSRMWKTEADWLEERKTKKIA